MREPHLTREMLDRFARAELPDEELFEVLDHLQTCPLCARAGQMRAAEDVEALQSELTEPASGGAARMRRWGWIAAAVLAAIVLPVLLPRRTPDANRRASPAVVRRSPAAQQLPAARAMPAAPTYGDPEWQRLVADASRTGALPFPPFLEELRAPLDIVRGSSGTRDRVSPASAVIDEARPTFTWPASAGQTYVVSVFDGPREVVRSARLRAPRWRPERDLPRGRTLVWQVEMTSGDGTLQTIPSLPSPPATFRIATAEQRRELDRARAQHGDDELLRAVLYARAGMRAEALASLRRAAANGSAPAQRILDHETSQTH